MTKLAGLKPLHKAVLMDFHATETTCMPSIRFHFLTFFAGTFFLLLAIKNVPHSFRLLVLHSIC
jgi:hypothetical protein